MFNVNITKSQQQELIFYYTNLNFFYVGFLVGSTILLCYGLSIVRLQVATAILLFILHHVYSLGITAGYHRLWTHKSYRACLPIRCFLAFVGAGQLQWSIIWWSTHHRAHHRYLDTDKDPYNARRGLFYSHVGWIIGMTPSTWGKVDVSDVKADPVAVWQQRYYIPIAILSGLVVPAIIAHVGWNDWAGGVFYAGVVRIYFYLQVTFLVNSLAHYAGTQPYSTDNTSRDNLFVALFTSGEGYHNFHHRFPADYRNGVHVLAWDPTKWFIWSCTRLGLASRLRRTPQREIESAYRNGTKSVG